MFEDSHLHEVGYKQYDSRRPTDLQDFGVERIVHSRTAVG